VRARSAGLPLAVYKPVRCMHGRVGRRARRLPDRVRGVPARAARPQTRARILRRDARHVSERPFTGGARQRAGDPGPRVVSGGVVRCSWRRPSWPTAQDPALSVRRQSTTAGRTLMTLPIARTRLDGQQPLPVPPSLPRRRLPGSTGLGQGTFASFGRREPSLKWGHELASRRRPAGLRRSAWAQFLTRR